MTGLPPVFRPRLAFRREERAAAPGRADAEGLQQRFRAEILPHLDGAYSLARYLTRDPAWAEDVVQDAFEKAFRGFAAFRGEHPRAWLYAIVRRSFLDSRTAARRRDRLIVSANDLDEAAVEMMSDPDAVSPEQAVAGRQDTQLIWAVIGRLPEPFRETLVMRDLEDLSYKDIAMITGSPIGTVMSRLARARRMLADMLPPHARPSQQDDKSGAI